MRADAEPSARLTAAVDPRDDHRQGTGRLAGRVDPTNDACHRQRVGPLTIRRAATGRRPDVDQGGGVGGRRRGRKIHIRLVAVGVGRARADSSFVGLRFEPGFRRWIAAEGVSLFGSGITNVVLPVVVFQTTGSVAQTGLLYALRVVPYLLLGLVAGPVADRGDRKALIVGGNVVQGLLVASIPVASALGVLTVAQIYVVGLLAASAFVFSDAAVFGAVPALVGPTNLAAANGALSSVASAADIAGPALGGLLAAALGATNAVWVDAASFFVAALIQWRIRVPFRVGPPATGENLVAQARRGLWFVRRHRTVGVLLGVGFGNSLAFGAVLGLLVPFAAERLRLAPSDARVGLLFSATGAGSLVSGLLFGRVFRVARIHWLSPASLALSAVAVTSLCFATGWVSAAAVFVAFTLAIATTIATGITYRQLAAPDDLRSSVNVLGRMIAWGGQPVGATIGAFVASTYTVRTAYAAAAGAMAITAGLAAALLLGRVDPVNDR